MDRVFNLKNVGNYCVPNNVFLKNKSVSSITLMNLFLISFIPKKIFVNFYLNL